MQGVITLITLHYQAFFKSYLLAFSKKLVVVRGGGTQLQYVLMPMTTRGNPCQHVVLVLRDISIDKVI